MWVTKNSTRRKVDNYNLYQTKGGLIQPLPDKKGGFLVLHCTRENVGYLKLHQAESG
jgi:hypothetical protein